MQIASAAQFAERSLVRDFSKRMIELFVRLVPTLRSLRLHQLTAAAPAVAVAAAAAAANIVDRADASSVALSWILMDLIITKNASNAASARPGCLTNPFIASRASKHAKVAPRKPPVKQNSQHQPCTFTLT